MERFQITTDALDAQTAARTNPLDATTIEEAIRMAINAEELGHKMYKEMAEKSTNPLAKSLLEELAADELTHCSIFKEIGREALGEPDPAVEAGCTSIEERIKLAFDKIGESAKEQVDDTQLEVLNKAIQLEKESYETYDELFKKASGNVRDIFDRIRREEYDHMIALQNILLYLTKTGQWFDIEESKRWNWMNT